MSSANDVVDVEVVIFGGGVAGLWLLDELLNRGCNAVLFETKALGSGQTVGSQGIIHGGLKYMFDGKLTGAVKAIAEMPVLWRECLQGQRQPDLSGTKVRSEGCWIWGTGSIKSRFFMAGSTIALRAAPVAVEREHWPAALAQVSGKVMRVPEQVIDTVSMVERFKQRCARRTLLIDATRGPEFMRNDAGEVTAVRVYHGQRDESVELRPKWIVLAAGEGNAALRDRLGLGASAMQRRPLHMVMARGAALPELFGHCVGGPRPRVTITTAKDSAGRTVWQIGGQIGEDGVGMSPDELVAHAKKELTECVPGLDLRGVELATYQINRAEAATAGGQKPDDAQVIRDANVLTAWPTKLALAPRLTERVIELTAATDAPGPWRTGSGPGRQPGALAPFADWPEPPVALPPWEQERRWTR